jgi:hypothetical protein
MTRPPALERVYGRPGEDRAVDVEVLACESRVRVPERNG